MNNVKQMWQNNLENVCKCRTFSQCGLHEVGPVGLLPSRGNLDLTYDRPDGGAPQWDPGNGDGWSAAKSVNLPWVAVRSRIIHQEEILYTSVT